MAVGRAVVDGRVRLTNALWTKASLLFNRIRVHLLLPRTNSPSTCPVDVILVPLTRDCTAAQLVRGQERMLAFDLEEMYCVVVVTDCERADVEADELLTLTEERRVVTDVELVVRDEEENSITSRIAPTAMSTTQPHLDITRQSPCQLNNASSRLRHCLLQPPQMLSQGTPSSSLSRCKQRHGFSWK